MVRTTGSGLLRRPGSWPNGIAVSTGRIRTKTVREGAIYLSGLGRRASRGLRPNLPPPHSGNGNPRSPHRATPWQNRYVER